MGPAGFEAHRSTRTGPKPENRRNVGRKIATHDPAAKSPNARDEMHSGPHGPIRGTGSPAGSLTPQTAAIAALDALRVDLEMRGDRSGAARARSLAAHLRARAGVEAAPRAMSRRIAPPEGRAEEREARKAKKLARD